MIDSIINILKKIKDKQKKDTKSKETAKERLHLVLMQDRANVSADFLEMMKQEIIDVIKKYIEVDESEIDVRLTNKENGDGTVGTPALYANIPITNVREKEIENNEVVCKNEKKEKCKDREKTNSEEKSKQEPKQESKKTENEDSKKIDENKIEKKDNIKKEEKLEKEDNKKTSTEQENRCTKKENSNQKEKEKNQVKKNNK